MILNIDNHATSCTHNARRASFLAPKGPIGPPPRTDGQTDGRMRQNRTERDEESLAQGGAPTLARSKPMPMHRRWKRGVWRPVSPALLLVVLVLALVSHFSAAAAFELPILDREGCLPLIISREAPRKSRVGRSFVIRFKLSAQSKRLARYWLGNGTSATVALTALDSGIKYQKSAVFPNLRPKRRVIVLDGGQTLVWQDVTMAGRYARYKYSFKTRWKVLPCAPPVVRFRALIQQSNSCSGPLPVEWTVSEDN